MINIAKKPTLIQRTFLIAKSDAIKLKRKAKKEKISINEVVRQIFSKALNNV